MEMILWMLPDFGALTLWKVGQIEKRLGAIAAKHVDILDFEMRVLTR